MLRSICAAIVVLGFFLVACAEPRIDGSSDAAFHESIEKIKATLDGQELIEFETALAELGLAEEQVALLASPLLAPIVEGYVAAFDGKTAEGLIAHVEEAGSLHQAAERVRTRVKLEALEAAKAEADLARAELAKFEVLSSSIHRRERVGFDSVTFRLTVRNGTDHPIAGVHFMGTLATPGRSVPWIKDEIRHGIPGGIEPGEEMTREFSYFTGHWILIEFPADAVLTVEPIELIGADSQPLFSSRGFTEEDARRLEELKATQQE